jgi:acyl-CoA-dependent ceramide synthase
MGRPRKSSHLGEIPGDTNAPAMSTLNEASPIEGESPKWDKVYPYR